MSSNDVKTPVLSFFVHRRKKVTQVWNDMRVSTYLEKLLPFSEIHNSDIEMDRPLTM